MILFFLYNYDKVLVSQADDILTFSLSSSPSSAHTRKREIASPVLAESQGGCALLPVQVFYTLYQTCLTHIPRNTRKQIPTTTMYIYVHDPTPTPICEIRLEEEKTSSSVKWNISGRFCLSKLAILCSTHCHACVGTTLVVFLQ